MKVFGKLNHTIEIGLMNRNDDYIIIIYILEICF